MGTNYYLMTKECPTCGHIKEEDKIHIGKSSAGWVFALHVHPDKGINSLEDWKKKWKEGIIKDGETTISIEDMTKIVEERSWIKHVNGDLGRFYTLNHAEPGPNNLARSKIDGKRCIGHGEGTWDLMLRDFS